MVSDFEYITEQQYADYHRICAELENFRQPDLLGLKQVWENNYEIIVDLDNKGASSLYLSLIARKDFLKQKHKDGSLKVYLEARLRCLGWLVYKTVWKVQIKELASLLEEKKDKEIADKMEELQNRIWVYEVENEFIKKVENYLQLKDLGEYYCVERVCYPEPPEDLGNFVELKDAENKMREILLEEMKKDILNFTL